MASDLSLPPMQRYDCYLFIGSKKVRIKVNCNRLLSQLRKILEPQNIQPMNLSGYKMCPIGEESEEFRSAIHRTGGRVPDTALPECCFAVHFPLYMSVDLTPKQYYEHRR